MGIEALVRQVLTSITSIQSSSEKRKAGQATLVEDVQQKFQVMEQSSRSLMTGVNQSLKEFEQRLHGALMGALADGLQGSPLNLEGIREEILNGLRRTERTSGDALGHL